MFSEAFGNVNKILASSPARKALSQKEVLLGKTK